MVLRWYTVVIDCNDVRKQAAWWAEAFGWQTIIETDDECVNVPGWVTLIPSGTFRGSGSGRGWYSSRCRRVRR